MSPVAASYTPVQQAYSTYTPVQQPYRPIVAAPAPVTVFQSAPTEEQILANFPPGSVVLPSTGAARSPAVTYTANASAATTYSATYTPNGAAAHAVKPVGPITWTKPTEYTGLLGNPVWHHLVNPAVEQRPVQHVVQPLVQPRVVQRPVIMQAPPPRVEHITVIHGPNGEVIGEERSDGWGNWGGLSVEKREPWSNRNSMEWGGAYDGSMGGAMMVPPPVPAAPAPTRGYDSYAYGGYAGVEFDATFSHANVGYRTLAERFPLHGSKRGRWVERPANRRHELHDGFAAGGDPPNNPARSDLE
jgi:hypothetical protein